MNDPARLGDFIEKAGNMWYDHARGKSRNRGDMVVEKYINIYMKRNSLLALFCATLVFIPFFIVALIYDVLPYDLAIAFAPFPLAFVCVLVSALSIVRFKKMIARQEALYNTPFSDAEADHLETTLYLSKDWLIWAGSCALHKKHIRSVKSRLESGGVGSSNRVTITTADNKRYVVWCLSATNIKKIKAWCKS